MKKKFIVKIIIPFVVLISLIIANLIIKNNSVEYIQNYGIRSYQSFSSFLNVISIVVGILCIGLILFFIVAEIKKRKTLLKVNTEKQIAEESQKREVEKKSAKLSVARPLQEDVIKNEYQEWLNSPDISSDIKTSLFCINGQMEEMDDYQMKLNTLIRNNGATYLTDTIDLLNKVEQYILRNIRKILNCLNVYNLDNSEDLQKLNGLLSDVENDNRVQLKNVKEFLFVTTDFLNQQGDDNTDIKKLNLYKDTILDSIKEDSVSEPKLKI